MIRESFVNRCAPFYTLVDDRYRVAVAPYDRRPGPVRACSDSGLIALILVAELVGLDEESAFLTYLRRNHPALLPRLPSLSGCVKFQRTTGGCVKSGSMRSRAKWRTRPRTALSLPTGSLGRPEQGAQLLQPTTELLPLDP